MVDWAGRAQAVAVSRDPSSKGPVSSLNPPPHPRQSSTTAPPSQIQEGFREISIFMLLFVLLSNLFACVFFALGHYEDSKDDPSWALGSNLYGDSRAHNYPAAVYWAVMTLTTVGYGDGA